jgi:hypothetical protein
MVTKKSTARKKAPKVEEPQSQAQETPPAPQEEPIAIPEHTPEPTPEPEQAPAPMPTLDELYQEIQALKHLALQHAGLIAYLQEALARKRKPVESNGKIQIMDKQTGMVYPSKNNAYQSLLKSLVFVKFDCVFRAGHL